MSARAFLLPRVSRSVKGTGLCDSMHGDGIWSSAVLWSGHIGNAQTSQRNGCFPDMTAKASGPPYGRKCSSGHTTFLTFLDTSIEDSITQMLKIGGYMVLFSVLSFFVCHLPALSAITRASLAALLEISLGCQLLVRLSVPLFWRYLLIVVTLTFGGLCSAFQSASYLRSIGFSLKNYIKTKAMTAVIALGLYLIYLLPSIGSGI